ncbi:MAG: long-chain fatty acid--CoA ligase [Candidatus Pelagadaptatus aseana]|uniref:class I adenylate-forming enzyme family protein n=1 Tax=Candidatus Pelagadaptatus aseana TaxID=3120508 RepID=UPI0039B1F36D
MATELQTNLIQRIAMGDVLRRRSVQHGNDEAVVDFVAGERRAIRYCDLNEQANRFVWAMREQGLKQGDTVAIIGENSPQFLVALAGCFKAGFTAFPINYLQSPDDLAYVMEHSGASALLADNSLHPIAAGLLDSASAKEVDDIIIDDNDTAVIMYTSGTTSRPKGVMLSHKAIYLSTLNGAVTLGARAGEFNSLSVLPLFHITALMFALTCVHLGSKIVLMKAFDPQQALDLMESESVNFAILLPLMWRALLASPGCRERDFSKLKFGLYGMAPMDGATLKTLKEVFECDFILGSGQTEIAAGCTFFQDKWIGLKEGNYWGDGSICCDQAVMDDQGNLLPPGEVGEIVWRGPQVMTGYYKNQDATEEAQAFGWHHSGDLGYIDEDNQLCFVDRKKDIIKTGGENVSSVLVESTVLSVPGVANVAVFGVPHPRWGEAVVAAVLVEPGAEVSQDDVVACCKNQLGGYQVPKKVVVLEAFPMTATGKVKKNEIRDAHAHLFESLGTV